MNDKNRASRIVVAVGCVLLASGAVYVVVGPVGSDHGWSEHDYAAWGLMAAGLALIVLIALPVRRVARRDPPRNH